MAFTLNVVFVFLLLVICTSFRTIHSQRTKGNPFDGAGPADLASDNDDSTRIICSYASWAFYRKGPVKYKPDDIDPNLCTDIHFTYIELNPISLQMRIRDSPKGPPFSRKVMGMKRINPFLKVHASLGGWVDSGDDRFSRLVGDSEARQNFIFHALDFLRNLQFDGLDISWMFPKCWRSNCAKGPDDDPQNFATFIQELRSAFDERAPEMVLSVTVSGEKEVIDNAYDVPALARSADFLHIMTYDFAGNWFRKTGIHSPLFAPQNTTWTVSSSINYWISKGAPANKLTLAIPTYGRSFTLDNRGQNGVGAPARNPGRYGEYYSERGRMAYFEICNLVKNGGWTKVVDPKFGVYAYQDDQWTSYDDVETAGRKAKYAKAIGLAGIVLWDLTTDDFKGNCCEVKYPLLSVINYVVRRKGVKPASAGCETTPPQIDKRVPTAT